MKEELSIFKEVFKGGKTDRYAKKWISKKDGGIGWSFECKNNMKPDVCNHLRTEGSKSCKDCENPSPLPLTDRVLKDHITGNQDSLGMYMVDQDATCCMGVFDCDNHKDLPDLRPDYDAMAFADLLSQLDLPSYIELSSSGLGYHVFVFLKSPVAAWKIRAIFKSLEARLIYPGDTEVFPKQNIAEAFGNLIALPLNGNKRCKGLSVFVDDDLKPYPDQWEFLKTVEFADEKLIDDALKKLSIKEPEKAIYEDDKVHYSTAGDADRVRKNCEFIKYCIDNRKTLDEPTWWVGVSEIAGLVNGREVCHKMSKDWVKEVDGIVVDQYDYDKVEEKYKSAVEEGMPKTCKYIQEELGFKCVRDCEVRAPICLGVTKTEREEEGKECREISFLDLGKGMLAEQIYDPELKDPHQFVIKTEEGFKYVTEIDHNDVRYLPARPQLVEGRAVYLAAKPIKYDSVKTLTRKIQSFIHKWIDIPKSYEIIVVNYIFFSWIYDCFGITAYLRALAEWGQGKSRFLQTLGVIIYKGMFCSGATTASPVFRMIDLFKGSLVIDEADFGKSEMDGEIVTILCQGNDARTPVLRSEAVDGQYQPVAYNVYSPKLIASRGRWTKATALESRCLTVNMEETKRDEIPLLLNKEFDQEALEIRNMLLAWRFDNYEPDMEVDESYRIKGLESRINQIMLPLLSVISSEEDREIIRDSMKSLQEELSEDLRTDRSGVVLQAIIKAGKQRKMVVRKGKRIGETIIQGADYTDIAERANELMEMDEKNKYALNAWNVAYIVKSNLKLGKGKQGNRTCIIWDEEKLKGLRKRYRLDGKGDSTSTMFIAEGDMSLASGDCADVERTRLEAIRRADRK